MTGKQSFDVVVVSGGSDRVSAILPKCLFPQRHLGRPAQ